MGAVHRNAPLRADETGPTLAADRFAGITRGMNHDAIRIVVMDVAVVELHLDGRLGIRIDRPLDDVVVVGTPIHVADKQPGERMPGFAPKRPPRQRPQPHVPVEAFGYGHGTVRRPRHREERTGLAIRVHLFQLTDATVANQIAGNAELALVFRALLHARLVDPIVSATGLDQGATFAHGDGDGFLAVDILAAAQSHN